MNYAWESRCVRCGGCDDPDHTVSSTPEVERFALELADRLEPLCRDRGRMLGVMKADGEWIVCLSHVASVQWEFIRECEDFDPSISAIAHDWSTVPTRSLGGHDLRALLVPAARGVTWKDMVNVKSSDPRQRPLPIAGGAACVCAAPKLVSYLTQDAGADRLPPNSIAMIELWCGAATRTRRHKQFAASCENCRWILPTLMCRSKR